MHGSAFAPSVRLCFFETEKIILVLGSSFPPVMEEQTRSIQKAIGSPLLKSSDNPESRF